MAGFGGGFVEALRSGAWVTRARIRLVAGLLLAVSILGVVFLIATSTESIDSQGRPLGTDFSNVYAAGAFVLEGQPAAPFNPAQQWEREQAIFGADTPFYGWHYPPFFLGVAALLASMPYFLALSVWQLSTLAMYLAAIGGIVSFIPPLKGEDGERSEPGGVISRNVEQPPPGALRAPTSPASVGGISHLWLLAAVAFPAVFINIGHGHNGFLSAALFGGGLLLLDRKPIVAGVLFGLLVYKPQFGILIPLVLIASGRWRAFAAAAITVALLILIVTLAFGTDVWRAFFESAAFTRRVVLEQGDTGWHKIQSVFAWTRMWGAPVALAYTMQGAVTLAVAISLVKLWRGNAAFAFKAAALLIGTLLATPYSLDYDLMLLAPAIAFLAAYGFAQGFPAWEKTLLAALWLVPLVARSVPQFTLIPLGAPLMLAAFVYVVQRANLESSQTLPFNRPT